MDEHEMRRESGKSRESIGEATRSPQSRPGSFQQAIQGMDIRVAEQHRERALLDGHALEERLALLEGTPPPSRHAQKDKEGNGITPSPSSAEVAVDDMGVDAVERMLKAEATAMQTALRFYKQQSSDAAEQNALKNQEEVIQRKRQALHEEAAALDCLEDRLFVGRACLSDAQTLRRPTDDSHAELMEARLRAEECEQAYEAVTEELAPMHDMQSRLMSLCRAAEARVAYFEDMLRSIPPSLDKALYTLSRTTLEGIQAFILVLAVLCGTPRLAFLALDTNMTGQLSMCEFDTGVRLQLGLDYESIAGMKLRSLFKEFDEERRGYITEDDFANCCPSIWSAYGVGSVKPTMQPLYFGAQQQIQKGE